MKTIKTLAILFIAIVAMSSCSKADSPVTGTASEEQLAALAGSYWYADVPISGETKNLLTLDNPDDTAPYNHIGAVVVFNNLYTDWSYWGFYYLNDDQLVNIDGLSRLTEDATFDFTMDSNGNITTNSRLANAPVVSDMHFQGDRITAKVTFNGSTLDVTFRQPDEAQETMMDNAWDWLLENDLVIGGDNYKYETGISDKDADGPSRARQH